MLLLLLLLQLYYRALFDHVSFEKGDVSAIFFFFLHITENVILQIFSVITSTAISDQDV